eukprot:1851901-Amphidinium_carterae.1
MAPDDVIALELRSSKFELKTGCFATFEFLYLSVLGNFGGGVGTIFGSDDFDPPRPVLLAARGTSLDM